MRDIKPLKAALVFGRKQDSVLELLDHAIAYVLLGVPDVVKDADGLPCVGVAKVRGLAPVAVERALVLYQPPEYKNR